MTDFEIGIIYGDQGKSMVKKLLKHYKLEEKLSGKKEIEVGIKPNLVVPKPAPEGATTDPAIIAGIIEYLQESGLKNIKILEGSWVGSSTKRAFEVCGYNKLAREYGVELINLKNDNVKKITVDDEVIKVCQQALEVDYLINVPVLKAHCQTDMTCALKNLKGCIPDQEKRRFHSLGLHKPIALLNKIIKSDLIIVDGIYGDLTFEEGGNPVKMDRLIIGDDPLLIDMYAANLLGYDYKEIGYINYTLADRMSGFEIDEGKIRQFNSPSNISIPSEELASAARNLKRYIKASSACSACYGNLIQALYRLQKRNKIDIDGGKLHIGQGYQGEKKKTGLGIGKCTRGFGKFLPGCPPSTDKIMDFLQENF